MQTDNRSNNQPPSHSHCLFCTRPRNNLSLARPTTTSQPSRQHPSFSRVSHFAHLRITSSPFQPSLAIAIHQHSLFKILLLSRMRVCALEPGARLTKDACE